MRVSLVPSHSQHRGQPTCGRFVDWEMERPAKKADLDDAGQDADGTHGVEERELMLGSASQLDLISYNQDKRERLVEALNTAKVSNTSRGVVEPTLRVCVEVPGSTAQRRGCLTPCSASSSLPRSK